MQVPPDLIPAGHRRCTRCGVVRPATATYFRPRADRPGALDSWCRPCHRVTAAGRYATPAAAGRRAAYLADPEVRARRAAWEAARTRTDRDRRRAARRSLLGRLRNQQATDRARLRRIEAGRPARDRRETVLRRLALRAIEIERIERAMTGDRKRGRKPAWSRPHPVSNGAIHR